MQRLAILLAAPLAALAAGCATTQPPSLEPNGLTAPKASAAPATAAFRRADLLGRAGPALDALLGAPALVRREGDGEFRRYALANCALIVILYPDEKGEKAAGHLDAAATRSGEAAPDLDQCLAAGLPAS